MDIQMKNDVSILVNEKKNSQEFHLYEVGYERCRPTKPSEYSPIDYWVLHYCVAGEGYFSTPQINEEHITAGDLFMIPANSKNMYFPKKENPWCYRWIGFSGSNVASLLDQINLNTHHCVIKGSFDTKLNILFEEIYDSFKKGNQFLSMSKSYALLDYLLENFSSNQILSQSEQVFQNILYYIDEHYTQNISIQQIAEEHKIDRTYLFKLFQKHKAINPSNYIQQLRLQKACSLLRKSSLNITDISYEVGFSSPSYFSKFFVTNMKVTPLQYRNKFIST